MANYSLSGRRTTQNANANATESMVEKCNCGQTIAVTKYENIIAKWSRHRFWAPDKPPSQSQASCIGQKSIVAAALFQGE